jgi:hypothetical protein
MSAPPDAPPSTGVRVITLRLDDDSTRTVPEGVHIQSSVMRENFDMDPDAEIFVMGLEGGSVDRVLDFMAKCDENPVLISRLTHKHTPGETLMIYEPRDEIVDADDKPLPPHSVVPNPMPISIYQTGNLESLGVPKWAIEWISALSIPQLFDVMLAADDMGVQTLMFLAAAQAACLRVRMTQEAHDRTFHTISLEEYVAPDMSPDEMEKAKKQFEDAEEYMKKLRDFDSEEASQLRKKFSCLNAEWTPYLVFAQKADRMDARRKAAESAAHEEEAGSDGSASSDGSAVASGAGSSSTSDDVTALQYILTEDDAEDTFPHVPESRMFEPAKSLLNTVTEPNFELKRYLSDAPEHTFKLVMLYA